MIASGELPASAPGAAFGLARRFRVCAQRDAHSTRAQRAGFSRFFSRSAARDAGNEAWRSRPIRAKRAQTGAHMAAQSRFWRASAAQKTTG